jgi:hypothetical protein
MGGYRIFVLATVTATLALGTSCGGGGGGGSGGGGGKQSAGAPAITKAPADVSVGIGGTAKFSVEAMGTEPLQYEWKKEGSEAVLGTGAALELDNVRKGNAGTYAVTVKNGEGTAGPAKATLSVTEHPAPSISSFDVTPGTIRQARRPSAPSTKTTTYTLTA